MYERFTERARQVMVLAEKEARGLKHFYIGTEHVLLGLLREEEGIASRVLGNLGVSLERVRAQVVRICGTGEEVTSGQLSFTPRTRKVLELALREALSLGQNYIGTEHVLLGLVRESDGVAARILTDMEAGCEKVRTEVLRCMGAGSSAKSERDRDSAVADELARILPLWGRKREVEITIKLDRGYAVKLREAVASRPHDEQWSREVYDALTDVLSKTSVTST